MTSLRNSEIEFVDTLISKMLKCPIVDVFG